MSSNDYQRRKNGEDKNSAVLEARKIVGELTNLRCEMRSIDGQDIRACSTDDGRDVVYYGRIPRVYIKVNGDIYRLSPKQRRVGYERVSKDELPHAVAIVLRVQS